MSAVEVNFDGLVGPTHNYGGLSFGNLASTDNVARVSNPRQAALQGLAKMMALHDRGIAQAILPPHERPAQWVLRSLGFRGDDRRIVATAFRRDREMAIRCWSASAMWTANAATVSPSADCGDGRVHLSVANLAGKFHRAIEAGQTLASLSAIFAGEDRFAVHPALPSTPLLGDEGAANHMRLCASHGDPGLEVFVHGRAGDDDGGTGRFPARQSRAAGEAVARRHRLDEDRTLFVRQDRDAIDAGVFHNDVIAVANENVLLAHERAFVDQAAIIAALGRFFGEHPFHYLPVSEAELPLADAVSSYLFNSQLVSLDGERMLLVVPVEARENVRARAVLERLLVDDNPIAEIVEFDLRQSMRNGGGPACLRLRAVLDDDQRAALGGRVVLDEPLHRDLDAWIRRHYRDRLSPDDLGDPDLADECRNALDEVTRILELGCLYPFQRSP